MRLGKADDAARDADDPVMYLTAVWQVARANQPPFTDPLTWTIVPLAVIIPFRGLGLERLVASGATPQWHKRLDAERRDPGRAGPGDRAPADRSADFSGFTIQLPARHCAAVRPAVRLGPPDAGRSPPGDEARLRDGARSRSRSRSRSSGRQQLGRQSRRTCRGSAPRPLSPSPLPRPASALRARTAPRLPATGRLIAQMLAGEDDRAFGLQQLDNRAPRAAPAAHRRSRGHSAPTPFGPGSQAPGDGHALVSRCDLPGCSASTDSRLMRKRSSWLRRANGSGLSRLVQPAHKRRPARPWRSLKPSDG